MKTMLGGHSVTVDGRQGGIRTYGDGGSDGDSDGASDGTSDGDSDGDSACGRARLPQPSALAERTSRSHEPPGWMY